MTQEYNQEHDFEVDASDVIGSLFKLLALAFLVGQAAVVSAYAAGLLAGLSAMTFAIVPVLVSVGFGVNMWLMRKGIARITPTRLEIRTRGGSQFYAWNDIAEVRIRRMDQMWLPDRWWWKLVGVKTDREIIELGLSRSLRLGFIPFQYGTDIVGAPTGFVRIVRVYVSDPQGFAYAVEKWLPGRVRSLE